MVLKHFLWCYCNRELGDKGWELGDVVMRAGICGWEKNSLERKLTKGWEMGDGTPRHPLMNMNQQLISKTPFSINFLFKYLIIKSHSSSDRCYFNISKQKQCFYFYHYIDIIKIHTACLFAHHPM